MDCGLGQRGKKLVDVGNVEFFCFLARPFEECTTDVIGEPRLFLLLFGEKVQQHLVTCRTPYGALIHTFQRRESHARLNICEDALIKLGINEFRRFGQAQRPAPTAVRRILAGKACTSRFAGGVDAGVASD